MHGVQCHTARLSPQDRPQMHARAAVSGTISRRAANTDFFLLWVTYKNSGRDD